MLYLYYGPDEFSRSEAIAAHRAQIAPEVADLNITRLEGRRLKIENLAAACEAFPFLADKRIVIVHDLLKQQKAGKDREELRTYLERVPPTCDLLFVESEDFDKRSTVFTYLKKAGELREFLPREGGDLLRWVAERSKALGVTIEPAAMQRLTLLVGGDSRTLLNELGKLASYVGGGGRIGVDAVDLLVQDETEQNLFAFIDDLSARRFGPASAGLRRLIADGQSPHAILFMVARQVRVLNGVKRMATQRMRPDDIANALGQKPFVVRKALDQARGFSEAELLRFHDRVLALDHASKTGRMEVETGLDLLVAEICA